MSAKVLAFAFLAPLPFLLHGAAPREIRSRLEYLSHRVNSDWSGRNISAGERRMLYDAAQKTMDCELSACGTSHRFTDGRIDWLLNPSPGKYREWTFHVSRHKFWTKLAEYYVLTGDEKAVAAWLAQIESWMEQMPPPPLDTPPTATEHWRVIDAGIRMVEWSRQMAAFSRSPQVTDEFLMRYFQSVREHGLRLRSHPANGNWLMSQLNGLLHIAVLYPFLEESAEWREYALGMMKSELERQVYPDGFQYELTPSYHTVVIGAYLEVDDLFGRLGMERPQFFREGLGRMFDVLVRLRDPQGRTPAFNDSHRELVRPWMQRAMRLHPSRKDFIWCATDGKDGCCPEFLSCAFPYAGTVVFRSSWSNDAVWACFDGSPFGRQHQHEDKLNFVLQAYGKNMLVEGQSYLYDKSDMRRYVVSTRAHNTIRIDGMDQNARKRYKWRDGDIKVLANVAFASSTTRDSAHAEYSGGYGGNLLDVRHERSVLFLRNEDGLPPSFVIVDRLFPPDVREHSFEAMWHLEQCSLEIGDGAAFNGDFGDGVGLSACMSDRGVRIRDMSGMEKPDLQGWMPVLSSKEKSCNRRPIPTPVVCGKFSRGYRLVTVFEPYQGGKHEIAGVEASSDPDDKSFVLHLVDGSLRHLTEEQKNNT